MTAEQTSAIEGYHPDFNDPDANLVVKSEDGVSFRVHDFYLKASSAVFRDMLSLSSNLQDNKIPLPETSRDLAMLLKVLTGSAGDVENFEADIHRALKLFTFVDKYDIKGGNHKWIVSLLERFIHDDPLECFAAACEHTPTEPRIARLSITLFPAQAIPSPSYHNGYGGKYTCNHLSLADQTNPAMWKTEYIQRLGLLNYLSYVHAWNVAYLQRAPETIDKGQILNKMADAFCSKLTE